MTTAALLILGLFLLYETGSRWLKKHRCAYCGKSPGHDEHCPYLGTGL